ncbi:MAG TPA: helix-turn-helix transcriptional regulator [Candidatus Limnocylindrales bacterium]|jgi:transcriptional regulator with XRE-family HTH domain|nr:helix-turn-helix transcriptional regulator [Candidatus Limnocylindrales bacterium]
MSTLGNVLRQAREVREMTAVDAARAGGISAAYLSKLEGDAVKRPSPLVLHRLSEALDVPYADLMRLCGYHVPGKEEAPAAASVATALFADLTVDEREELVEYLAWYRARRRSVPGRAHAVRHAAAG